tara:strand:+ start:178 stop:2676 length:2499 start_codon:yes stop_codon:yes gene_type:complete
MATNFDDIMSNFDNMSVEELGSSLLARQAQRRKEAAKAAKKNEKIQKALGVLLAGQAIFKNTFQKRQNELQELKTLDLLNVESDAKKLNIVSDVFSVIPENYFPELNPEERTNKFFSDRNLGNQFKNKIKPIIDVQLKATSVTPTSPEYNAILEYGSKELLLDIFKGNKDTKFYNDLQTLDPSSQSREELFKTYYNITPAQLTQQKTKLYKQLENNLRKKSGVIGATKEILRKISRDKQSEGELGLFSNITEADIEGANLNEMLDSINIIGTLMPSIDKAVSMSQISPQRYRNQAMSKQNEDMRARLSSFDFVNLMDDVAEDRVLDKFNLLSAVDTSKFERLNKYFERNSGEKESMITDATALALRFQDDPQFAVDLYKTVTNDPNKIKQFKNQIRDLEFRNKFALAMTIKAGARPGWRAGTSDYVGTDLYSKDLESQGYDPDLGYNNMTALVERPIDVDANNNFTTNNDYRKLSSSQKLIIFDKQVDIIVNAPISTEAKQKTLDNLFDNVDIPEIESQEDYFEYRKEKINTERQEQYLSPNQKQSYDVNVQRIENLQRDINQGIVTEIDFTGISKRREASPRDVKNMENQIQRLEESNRKLLENPKGELRLLNKIQRIETEIDDVTRRLPILKENLGPSAYQRKVEELNDLQTELKTLQSQYEEVGEIEQPKVFESKATGLTVTKDAIDAVSFGDDNVRLFLNRVAQAESKFGNDENTFNTPSPNIFQVEKDGGFLEVQRRLQAKDIGANVKRYNKKLKDTFNIDLTEVSYEDLDKPIISAAFARAYLLIFPDPIPTDLKGQANYWKNNYNTGAGKGTVSRFVREGSRIKI